MYSEECLDWSAGLRYLHMMRHMMQQLSMPVVTKSVCADAQVFGGLNLKPGDRILTSVSEYGSNFLAYLQVIALSPPPSGVPANARYLLDVT